MCKNVKILVACHNEECSYPNLDIYMPIHVGKAISSINLGIQGDNDGDNISSKNPYYCELTAIYWAWKNLKNVDVIGLCHYRRYFDFHSQCRPFFSYTSYPRSESQILDFSINDEVLHKVNKGAVVVAKAESMRCTLKQNYCTVHYSKDLDAVETILGELDEDKYLQAYYDVIERGYKLSPYNMFIMKWTDFDSYCTWLFSLLERIENNTDISSYSKYQKRIYGFLAERLLNVWIYAENKVIIEKPIILLKDNDLIHNKLGPRKIFRELKRNVYCKIINCIYKRTHDYL